MARYSEEEKRKLHKVQILEIMAHYGKRLDHTRNALYFSPFRDEDTPSFHVDERRNTWYDYGTGEGGSMFDFVCKFAGISRAEVYDWLARFRGLVPEGRYAEMLLNVISTTSSAGTSKVIIDSTSHKFTKKPLVEYARSRAISEEILVRYCEEVFYHIDGRSGRFYSIGFKNNSGGYVLRSSISKRCSSSDVTTLGPDGMLTEDVKSEKVVVFEGFIDLLSWLSHVGQATPNYDCCVLNSVANLKKAMPWIAQHSSIAAFMDNDEAGKKAFRTIIEGVAQSTEVVDMSTLYAGYNDLNDKLMRENL